MTRKGRKAEPKNTQNDTDTNGQAQTTNQKGYDENTTKGKGKGKGKQMVSSKQMTKARGKERAPGPPQMIKITSMQEWRSPYAKNG